MFVDSDDFISNSNIIEKFINILERDKCDFIYTSQCRFDDGNEDKITEVLSINLDTEDIKGKSGLEILAKLIENNNYHLITTTNEANIKKKINDRLNNENIEDIKHSNKYKLISVGRLSKEKEYDRLFRVFKNLKSDGLNIELLLVGSGEKHNELNKYILENKLTEDVALLGFKDNPYKYMKSSDLFVCSSISEGFSLVIGEAMAVGVPVISVDCSGPNEVLDFGKYSKLVNNNEVDLYNGIKEIINDKLMYEKYKIKASERGKMFSVSNFINVVEDILDENKLKKL